MHDGDAVGESDGLVEVVGDEHDRLVQRGLQAEELILHLPADQRVQGREGLVQEPDVGLHCQRSTDAHPLLLATGELAGVVVASTLQPDQVDDLERLGVPGLSVDALHLEGEGHVLDHRAVGEQGEVLEHHAHLVAAEFDHFLVRGGQEVLAVEIDLASGGVDEARKAAHQGRLAGAAEAHQDDDLALVDLERCIADGWDVAGLLDRFDRWVPIVGGKELHRVGPVQLPDVPADDLGLGHRFGPRSDGRPMDSCVRKLGWKSDWPVAEGVGPGNRPDTTTPSGTVP